MVMAVRSELQAFQAYFGASVQSMIRHEMEAFSASLHDMVQLKVQQSAAQQTLELIVEVCAPPVRVLLDDPVQLDQVCRAAAPLAAQRQRRSAASGPDANDTLSDMLSEEL